MTQGNVSNVEMAIFTPPVQRHIDSQTTAILQPSLSIHFWVRESVKGESQASVPQPGDARVNASAFDYVYAVEAQGQGPSHVKSE